MTDTIRNGFRKCGLYPFNVEEVDFTKCVRDAQMLTTAKPTEERKFTERHFQIAKDVFLLICDNLEKRGVDTKIIASELENARQTHKRQSKSQTPRNSTSKTPRKTKSKTPRNSTSKSPRNSTSKTPRSSTSKPPRNSASKTPQKSLSKKHSLTPDITPNNISHIVSHSIVTETVDNSFLQIGSLISLDGVSITPFDDTSTIDLSAFSRDILALETNCNITVTADVHLEPSTEGTTSNVNSKEFMGSIENILVSDVEDEFTKGDSRVISCVAPTTSAVDIPVNDGQDLPLSPINIVADNTQSESEVTLPPVYLVAENKENVKTDDNDPFKKHLKYPLSSQDSKKKLTATYIPSAISSKVWRDFYEKKDEKKKEKEEGVRKRKKEREDKRLNQLMIKKRKIEGKKKKKNTKDGKNIKCESCQEDLISDIEEDTEKNIGCDECIRWYHLKCTKLKAIAYSVAAQSDFQCEFCEIAAQARQDILMTYK